MITPSSLVRYLCAALALFALAAPALAQEDTATDDQVARGKYLVTIAGCNDCHTPLKMGANGPEPDMSRMLSGHPQSLEMPPAPAPQDPWAFAAAVTNTAWAGPWGVSFTANLTPDRETGLGKWTLRNFVETIRTGRHLGRGRAILPPMHPDVQAHDGRRPGRRVRVPAIDPARQEQGAVAPSAGRAACRLRGTVTPASVTVPGESGQ